LRQRDDPHSDPDPALLGARVAAQLLELGDAAHEQEQEEVDGDRVREEVARAVACALRRGREAAGEGEEHD
jgi:hypothetical protein